MDELEGSGGGKAICSVVFGEEGFSGRSRVWAVNVRVITMSAVRMTIPPIKSKGVVRPCPRTEDINH